MERIYNINKHRRRQRWSFFLKRRKPAEILVSGFALIILTGTFLLMLPISSVSGRGTDFLNALFTATSSVCVTGLIVVDTGTYWSYFGQMVIILLIQIGGLGFMSMMTIFFIFSGRTITIRERLILQSSVNKDKLQGIIKYVKYMVASTVSIEIVGGLLFATVFIPELGFGKGIYFGFWHSISTYCNAGFDLIGQFRSFTPYVENGLIAFTACALIVLGGLGFATTNEIIHYKKSKRLSVHTKIVLIMTVVLITSAAILIFLCEYHNPETLGPLSLKGKIYASLYQSITPRTAGSNTIDQTLLTKPVLFISMILMFVGGSPGSTAGGVKTTTIATMFLNLKANLMGTRDVTLFKRRLPLSVLQIASALFFIAVLINVTVSMVLIIMEPNIPMEYLVFEVISAYSTVGLTCNVTPALSDISKWVLVFTMFAGRVGPLTIAYVLTRKEQMDVSAKGQYRLPEENILLG